MDLFRMDPSKSLLDIKQNKQYPGVLRRQITDSICPLPHRLPGKALRACFLRNTDQYFGGISLPVSKKRYQHFQALLEGITSALRPHVVLKSAITKIYRIDGSPLFSLDNIYECDILVCCCQYESFVDVGYNVNPAYMRLLGSLIRMRQKFNPAAVKDTNVTDKRVVNCGSCKLPQSILLYMKVKNIIWANKSTVIFAACGRAQADKHYIIKMVNRDSGYKSPRTKGSCFETDILRQLQDHANIIDLIYTVEQFKFIYIVIERLDCDLLDLLQKGEGKFSETLTKKIMRDVSRGLEYIHEQQIIHRDLKLENLLVKLDSSGSVEPRVVVVKISDFGLATYYEGRKLYQCCGTNHYMAPELINFVGYDFSVDLWSLGVTLFAMLCGEMPFANTETNPGNIYESIRMGHVEIPQDCKSKMSLYAHNLIVSLLVKTPMYRLSATEVCKHKFLQDNKDDF